MIMAHLELLQSVGSVIMKAMLFVVIPSKTIIYWWMWHILKYILSVFSYITRWLDFSWNTVWFSVLLSIYLGKVKLKKLAMNDVSLSIVNTDNGVLRKRTHNYYVTGQLAGTNWNTTLLCGLKSICTWNKYLLVPHFEMKWACRLYYNCLGFQILEHLLNLKYILYLLSRYNFNNHLFVWLHSVVENALNSLSHLIEFCTLMWALATNVDHIAYSPLSWPSDRKLEIVRKYLFPYILYQLISTAKVVNV